jgi:hypothetical protein
VRESLTLSQLRLRDPLLDPRELARELEAALTSGATDVTPDVVNEWRRVHGDALVLPLVLAHADPGLLESLGEVLRTRDVPVLAARLGPLGAARVLVASELVHDPHAMSALWSTGLEDVRLTLLASQGRSEAPELWLDWVLSDTDLTGRALELMAGVTWRQPLKLVLATRVQDPDLLMALAAGGLSSLPRHHLPAFAAALARVAPGEALDLLLALEASGSLSSSSMGAAVRELLTSDDLEVRARATEHVEDLEHGSLVRFSARHDPDRTDPDLTESDRISSWLADPSNELADFTPAADAAWSVSQLVRLTGRPDLARALFARTPCLALLSVIGYAAGTSPALLGPSLTHLEATGEDPMEVVASTLKGYSRDRRVLEDLDGLGRLDETALLGLPASALAQLPASACSRALAAATGRLSTPGELEVFERLLPDFSGSVAELVSTSLELA